MLKRTMLKRAPYLEIVLTVAVMAFLALVIAGTFNARDHAADQMILRPE